MQTPKDIKELGTWIWNTIKDVYLFIQKPFAGIFLLLVSIGWAWYISDSKFQEGYDAGVKNQLTADLVNITNLKNQITGLQSEKADMAKKNSDLQARLDNTKNVDWMEQSEKVFAYVDSVEKRLMEKNKSKAQKIRETEEETRRILAENKTIESLMKNKKQK